MGSARDALTDRIPARLGIECDFCDAPAAFGTVKGGEIPVDGGVGTPLAYYCAYHEFNGRRAAAIAREAALSREDKARRRALWARARRLGAEERAADLESRISRLGGDLDEARAEIAIQRDIEARALRELDEIGAAHALDDEPLAAAS